MDNGGRRGGGDVVDPVRNRCGRRDVLADEPVGNGLDGGHRDRHGVLVGVMGPGMPPKLTIFTLDGRLTVQVECDTADHSRTQMGRVEKALTDALRHIATRRSGVVAT